MNPSGANRGEFSAIDLALVVMDSPRRPLDFTLLFHFSEAPGIEALRVGAISARNLYPTTGSHLEGKHWVRFPHPEAGVGTVSIASSREITKVVNEFLERPIDLRTQMPVQQLVLVNETNSQVTLVTRFHHAVADGMSAAMWLGHQLRVAHGKETPVTSAAPFQELALRSHPAPVRKSRFAYRGASDRLWTRNDESSGGRRWLTIKIPAAALRNACRGAGFTYNDLLATCALEVFSRWNRQHCGERKLKLGLWLPVNIRRQSTIGFGNGTGRIRLYHRAGEGASIADKCRGIRQQLSWTTQHGEWAVPGQLPFKSLPFWLTGKLLRGYLNRPGVDMATGVFSHAERWMGEDSELYKHLEKIESIGQLDRRHCVAINGATHHGETWLTFTYDPTQLALADIQSFVEMYQQQIGLAQQELAADERGLNADRSKIEKGSKQRPAKLPFPICANPRSSAAKFV